MDTNQIQRSLYKYIKNHGSEGNVDRTKRYIDDTNSRTHQTKFTALIGVITGHCSTRSMANRKRTNQIILENVLDF